MTRARRHLLMALGGIALLLAPWMAEAGSSGSRGGGGRPGAFVGHRPPAFVHRGPVVTHPEPSVFPTYVDPWKSWGVQHRHFHGHRFNTPSFVSPYVVTPSTVISSVTSTPVYPTSVVVVTPPAESPRAPAYPPVPSSPPGPSVVEFSTGRYELRGDGISAPYVWVWIPNPPPAPPASPPADAPRSGNSQDDRSTRVGEYYRWTDEQGVTTWTDRLSKVPERYRAQALTGATPK